MAYGLKCLLLIIYFFIGNSDFRKHKKKHMFTGHMLDRYALEHDNKTKEVLEDIKTFGTSFIIK